MSKRISYQVEGDVQGVNYRSWAAGEAKKLNVTGYAKNAEDGTVVGEAQGDASSLDKFVQHLNKGPSAASVNKVDQKEIGTKSGDSGFDRRSFTTSALSKQSAAQILRSLNGTISTTSAVRPAFICLQQQCTTATSRRNFSTSKPALMKEFFPPPNAPNIRTTEPAWAHPVYTFEQMEAVKVDHRNTKDWSDYVAISAMRVLRWGLDLATGYKHDKESPQGHALDSTKARPKTLMTEKKWMVRFVFLESVAGVPGMVAGMLRHLHSMRRMKRDNGWIETLLEESYNERMHLLTFLKMAEPGWFMRLMVLGAQGVFFNGMFISYLISPRTCHRFVGYLEEEAVLTYTRAIDDMDAGKLPLFEKTQAPDIAVKYWNMPEGHRTMRDLLLYIRADESKHREVNHTLGNLDQKNDPNPYVSTYKDEGKPHPVKDIQYQRPTGWERDEVIGSK
ncbi:Alternative oxidase, mitochondrial precursor [Oleoguttula mirabilis]|uniref:Alternative oxidase n=1 Tax=Oleoguttula mirabilis TaxID=1507867 RepID=A0AAV9J6B9_9PEZI|nr:Alternative oxidase, mitochondrial precursor [Oleoguttula mirabilis]